MFAYLKQKAAQPGNSGLRSCVYQTSAVYEVAAL